MPELNNSDFEERLALTLGEDERIPGRERPDFWELPSSVGGKQPVLPGRASGTRPHTVVVDEFYPSDEEASAYRRIVERVGRKLQELGL